MPRSFLVRKNGKKQCIDSKIKSGNEEEWLLTVPTKLDDVSQLPVDSKESKVTVESPSVPMSPLPIAVQPPSPSTEGEAQFSYLYNDS